MSETAKGSSEAKAWRRLAEWVDERQTAIGVAPRDIYTHTMQTRLLDHCGLPSIIAMWMLSPSERVDARVMLCELFALECESEVTP